jgi:O-antigen ligase
MKPAALRESLRDGLRLDARRVFSISIALLPLLALAGWPFSYDRSASAATLAILTISVLVFLVASWAAGRTAVFQWALAVYATGAAVAALLGLLCAEWSLVSEKLAVLAWITDGLPFHFATDPPLHPNGLAGGLLWPLPPAVVLAWAGTRSPPRTHARAKSLQRFVTGTAAMAPAIVTASVFLLTQSRSAYLALLVTTAAFARSRGAAPSAKRRAGLAAKVSAGAVLLVVLAAVGIGRTGGASGWKNAFSLESLRARSAIWTRGLSLAAERPLTGIGLGAFAHVVHRLRPFDDSRTEQAQIPPDERIGHAHNVYLQTLLDLGAAGLLALLALHAAALGMMRAAWCAARDPVIRATAVALGAGLVANALFGLVDAIPLGSKIGVLFWIHLGLIHALHARFVPGKSTA